MVSQILNSYAKYLEKLKEASKTVRDTKINVLEDSVAEHQKVNGNAEAGVAAIGNVDTGCKADEVFILSREDRSD